MSIISAYENSTLSGELSGGHGLSGILTVPKVIEENTNVYQGDYEIIPDVHDTQTLETANKVLKQNIVVAAVPYYETGNSSDGTTVYIGKEV